MDDLFVQWDNIVTDIKQVCFNTHSYRIRWSLEKKGIFTTKFVYRWLERNLVGASIKWIWKAVIPLKIKISMWQLFRDSILTRYNLKKWVILFFFFCNNAENANHLFFGCHMTKAVWGTLRKGIEASCCPRSLWQSFTWHLVICILTWRL